MVTVIPVVIVSDGGHDGCRNKAHTIKLTGVRVCGTTIKPLFANVDKPANSSRTLTLVFFQQNKHGQ